MTYEQFYDQYLDTLDDYYDHLQGFRELDTDSFDSGEEEENSRNRRVHGLHSPHRGPNFHNYRRRSGVLSPERNDNNFWDNIRQHALEVGGSQGTNNWNRIGNTIAANETQDTTQGTNATENTIDLGLPARSVDNMNDPYGLLHINFIELEKMLGYNPADPDRQITEMQASDSEMDDLDIPVWTKENVEINKQKMSWLVSGVNPRSTEYAKNWGRNIGFTAEVLGNVHSDAENRKENLRQLYCCSEVRLTNFEADFEANNLPAQCKITQMRLWEYLFMAIRFPIIKVIYRLYYLMSIYSRYDDIRTEAWENYFEEARELVDVWNFMINQDNFERLIEHSVFSEDDERLFVQGFSNFDGGLVSKDNRRYF